MMTIINQWAMIIFQLLIATVCGGIIGYQREASERPAGFRTHVLVCVGSAVYMMVSVAVAGHQYDPSRIAAQVASGIGFLGAGTIIKQGSIVRGLTTAASLWAVAGIGLAAGHGGTSLAIALIGTLIVFLALTSLKNIEVRMERRHRSFQVTITVKNPRQRLEWVNEILALHGLELYSISISNEDGDMGNITVEGRGLNREDLDRAISDFIRGEDVQGVRSQYR